MCVFSTTQKGFNKGAVNCIKGHTQRYDYVRIEYNPPLKGGKIKIKSRKNYLNRDNICCPDEPVKNVDSWPLNRRETDAIFMVVSSPEYHVNPYFPSFETKK
jgi:hypothetical protein